MSYLKNKMNRVRFFKYFIPSVLLLSFMCVKQYQLSNSSDYPDTNPELESRKNGTEDVEISQEHISASENKFQDFFVYTVPMAPETQTVPITQSISKPPAVEFKLPPCDNKNNPAQRLWHYIKNETQIYNLTQTERDLVPELECQSNTIPDDLWATSGISEDKLLKQVVWMMEASEILNFSELTPKTIVVWDGMNWWNKPKWQNPSEESCPGTPKALWEKCTFTNDHSLSKTASAVLATKDWAHTTIIPSSELGEETLKITFILESTYHSSAALNRPLDILASYWRGSDILTPYGKWSYFNEDIKQQNQTVDYSVGKTIPVAMFSSNCHTVNDRLGYVKELQKYIQVDIYGACGTIPCNRFTEPQRCFDKLKNDYFFYIAFENSNCRDYITEKFYGNALANNVVPVVMGGHPDDYKAMAPANSYIHVEDFNSPKELADHLNHLIKSTEEYNRYFAWKGTGRFVQHEFFCRICALVHYSQFYKPKSKPFVWKPDAMLEDANGNRAAMCLPRGKWYWTK